MPIHTSDELSIHGEMRKRNLHSRLAHSKQHVNASFRGSAKELKRAEIVAGKPCLENRTLPNSGLMCFDLRGRELPIRIWCESAVFGVNAPQDSGLSQNELG